MAQSRACCVPDGIDVEPEQRDGDGNDQHRDQIGVAQRRDHSIRYRSRSPLLCWHRFMFGTGD
jgi:hypothetical protein